jgi:hypothetical protein
VGRTEYVVDLEREIERLRTRIEQISASHIEAIRLARIEAAEQMRESIAAACLEYAIEASGDSYAALVREVPLPGEEKP